jgi:hypothetical protein
MLLELGDAFYNGILSATSVRSAPKAALLEAGSIASRACIGRSYDGHAYDIQAKLLSRPPYTLALSLGFARRPMCSSNRLKKHVHSNSSQEEDHHVFA